MAPQQDSFKAENPVVQVIGEVSDYEVLKNLVKTAIDCFGKINILVKNVGFPLPTSIYDLDFLIKYDKQIDGNLKQAIALSQLTVPYLEKTKEFYS